MTQAVLSLICPAGHGPMPPGAAFCTRCGAALVPPAAQAPGAGPAAHPGYICPNGHGPMPPGSGAFCTQCGAAFVPLAPNSGRAPAPTVAAVAAPCSTCGGDGARLPASVLVCRQCRWLRPLTPGYMVDQSAFQWALDGAAMAKLRSIGPLMAAARAISDRVGRRWVETMFNGVRLSENQLSEVYHQAVRAARLLGMRSMPDVYVSGDRMWDAATYGSDHSSFIVIGTALLNSFREEEVLFLLAREMGHCRAGHALWKTVGTFLMGEQGAKRGVMSGGVLQALNPDKLLESAIEMPLLAWARQAEITADRAGMLALGDETVARRVLLSWSLRSVPLYNRINIEAWLEQQEDDDDQMTRLSELVASPTPYITRRLKLLRQFARSDDLTRMRGLIAPLDYRPSVPAAPSAPGPQGGTVPVPPAQRPASQAGGAPSTPPAQAPAADYLRLTCPGCSAPMRIPRAVLEGKDVFPVRCPNRECGKVITLKKPAPPSPPPAAPYLDERLIDNE